MRCCREKICFGARYKKNKVRSALMRGVPRSAVLECYSEACEARYSKDA